MSLSAGKITLVPASLVPPSGLMELLSELGDGENGFQGTRVHNGEMTIEKYLRNICDDVRSEGLPPGRVPQTVYWMIDARGVAVGILRLRHYLNDQLRHHGGHIGYFIRRHQRGKGYAREALQIALKHLSTFGEKRALLTVHPANVPSIKVIEGAGGVYDSDGIDPETGAYFKRYWIELS